VLAKLVALAWLAYITPGERVVTQLAAARAGQAPIHVETAVSCEQAGAARRLAFDLHPELGLRASDDRGRRWLVQRGRVVAGSQVPAPAWLPDLEVLALASPDALQSWLIAHGVDATVNELARCGESDCWVLGGRQASAQLWIDKNALEIRRVVAPGQEALELARWRAFEKRRFPAEIALGSDSGSIARFAVESVVAAPTLGSGDFSAAWVQAAPALPE
jgi:hypothetical protein